MNKLIACLVAVAAVSLVAEESNAQFYHRGGTGISIGIGSGFNNFGYNNFNRGFNRGFGPSVGGFNISVGNRGFGPGVGFPVNRGFYGGGVPYYAARPAFVPVYRGYGGGGFHGGGYRGYGGNRGCGF